MSVEKAYLATLMTVRKALEQNPGIAKWAGARLSKSKERLESAKRKAKPSSPNLEALYSSNLSADEAPQELLLPANKPATSRAALGNALGYLNKLTSGAFMVSAADLLDSTSISGVNSGFPKGFYHAKNNPGSRLIPVGGICEDAMGAMMGGLSSWGRHIGVTSSYSSFIAALEHIAARLHGIGQQSRNQTTGEPYRTWIMTNAHAGSMTGEDGPTHADPQALQLLQNNFPGKIMITLTPWEPQEVWPLLIAGIRARPAVLAPFVTRPAEPVIDRKAMGLPPASAAAQGVYAIRRVNGDKTLILQGSSVMTIFVRDVWPKLNKENWPINVFYVAGAELFDLLDSGERERILPARLMENSMGITDFTWPTMSRWVRSANGMAHTLHPFQKDKYLGSGGWRSIMAEGGMDGASQVDAIGKFMNGI